MSRSLARQSLLVAVVAALIDVVVLSFYGAFAVAPWQTGLAVATIVAADLALAAPPRTAGVVAIVHVLARLSAGLLLYRLGFLIRFADIGFVVAGYRAGAWLSGPKSVSTMVLMCGGLASAHLLTNSPTAQDWLLLIAITASGGCVPWLVGRYTAARGAYIAELEQHAQLRQQEHRAALDRAVADERAAIARDLHDVISHHVSAIGIHAGAARLALGGGADATVARSLSAVESNSRAAMVDLRRQLDLLHGRDDDGQRQPGLADIDGLIDHVRDAGLDVTLTIRGTPRELPDSLSITLYRIVQEMLTNALRHGDGTHASVEVEHLSNRVALSATNPLPPESAVDHSGADTPVSRGLGGIRRRVELFDGELTFGRSSNHWQITVSMPIGGT
ncbi:sensor histidine kinase [Nocardia sp. CNY236]|uniref:sensor histidine kinase n=1 Tax=Nocardia sp. CNY236 TaxID=1169152 RepID=UPI0004162E99|nr:histidine kinase [Nocardia sp. CNY236]